MRKIVTLILIILVLSVGIFVYTKFYQNQNPERADPTQTQGKKSPTSTDNSIHFSCDYNKFFILTTAEVEGAQVAEVVINNNTSVFVLQQSTSSPHLFENAGGSLYVEGDEASLEIDGEVFRNCEAARV